MANKKIESVAQLNSTMTTQHAIIAQHIANHPELTYAQIAAVFDVSRHTVIRVAAEAHLKRSPGVKLKLKAPS